MEWAFWGLHHTNTTNTIIMITSLLYHLPFILYPLPILLYNFPLSATFPMHIPMHLLCTS